MTDEEKLMRKRASARKHYLANAERIKERNTRNAAIRKARDPEGFNQRAKIYKKEWRRKNLEHARKQDRERQKRHRDLASVVE